jgi:hypothetical protein
MPALVPWVCVCRMAHLAAIGTGHDTLRVRGTVREWQKAQAAAAHAMS